MPPEPRYAAAPGANTEGDEQSTWVGAESSTSLPSDAGGVHEAADVLDLIQTLLLDAIIDGATIGPATNEADAPSSYGASALKRSRRTNAQLADLDNAIIYAVRLDAPVTLRGVYYRVVSAGAVDKTEAGYRAVGRRLLELRRDGRVSYADITDGTRWVTAPTSYDSVNEMLLSSARQYRRSLWSRSETVVEVFTEKDAISGVLLPITARWDVPLGVMRGYSSESFVWTVADQLDRTRHTVIVQLGDHDPSGVGAWEDFQKKLRGFAPDASIEFVRLAVTEEQIEIYDLPTRPTKRSDSRSNNWVGGSVEVDAIPAGELRALLDEFLAQFHDPAELERLAAVEAAERQSVYAIANQMGGAR
jgi:hypothetical protein